MYSHDAGEEYADVNWDDLKFGGLYEGLKVNRTEDGLFLLFRPELNALRMKMGAERLCMPSPSTQQFIDAIKQKVLANKCWVPPPGKGTLYLRPLLMGSGSVLGMGPAPEYTFLIFASPVGNYHKAALNLYVEDKLYRATPGGTGGVKSITNYSPLFRPEQNALLMKNGADRLCMPSTSVDAFVDAVKQTALANKRWVPTPGKGSLCVRPLLLGSGPVLGIGPAPEYTFLIFASPIGNWYKVFEAVSKAKAKGFTDVLFLDAATGKNVELVSSCHVFIVKGLYEGLKANRTEDGRFLLFRPELNALRMKMGAERLCMPSPSTHQFIDAIKQTVLANKLWVLTFSIRTLHFWNLQFNYLVFDMIAPAEGFVAVEAAIMSADSLS
ncbi:hypothetical protein ACE6H2_027642 [Prunus campanulata]